MNEYLLDTSALVEFFAGTEAGAQACASIEDNVAAISILSIAELSDFCAKRGTDPAEQIAFLQRHVHILPLTAGICARAGDTKFKQRSPASSFSLIDSLIYLTAQEHKCVLVTKDKDFKGMKDVVIL